MDANDELMAGVFNPKFEKIVLEETGRGETLANLWGSVGRASEMDSACWLEQPPPPREYLLSTQPEHEGFNIKPARGMLPLGKVAMLAAAGGVGKSWLVTQMALSVATGRPWLDKFDVTAPGHVLLALGEEERVEVRRRLYNVAQAMALTAEEIALVKQRVFFLPLCGKPVCLTQETDDHGKKLSADFGETQETVFAQVLCTRLIEAGHPWSLVVFDPMSRFAGPEAEIDNSAATRFVQVLERFCEVPGHPTVLISHHTTKTSRDPKNNAGASAARGASALTDGVRWQANLEPVGEPGESSRQHVKFSVTKSNYAMFPEPVMLVRDEKRNGVLRPVNQDEAKEYAAACEEASINRGVQRKSAAAKVKERWEAANLDEETSTEIEDIADVDSSASLKGWDV